mmetsp:Transcript_38606/g.110972  ORF Transcript_38606/g.110972 Transcript_38606/m.110972 type:complete len:396 (-) Transcript_38606:549-1736(-)
MRRLPACNKVVCLFMPAATPKQLQHDNQGDRGRRARDIHELLPNPFAQGFVLRVAATLQHVGGNNVVQPPPGGVHIIEQARDEVQLPLVHQRLRQLACSNDEAQQPGGHRHQGLVVASVCEKLCQPCGGLHVGVCIFLGERRLQQGPQGVVVRLDPAFGHALQQREAARQVTIGSATHHHHAIRAGVDRAVGGNAFSRAIGKGLPKRLSNLQEHYGTIHLRRGGHRREEAIEQLWVHVSSQRPALPLGVIEPPERDVDPHYRQPVLGGQWPHAAKLFGNSAGELGFPHLQRCVDQATADDPVAHHLGPEGAVRGHATGEELPTRQHLHRCGPELSRRRHALLSHRREKVVDDVRLADLRSRNDELRVEALAESPRQADPLQGAVLVQRRGEVPRP